MEILFNNFQMPSNVKQLNQSNLISKPKDLVNYSYSSPTFKSSKSQITKEVDESILEKLNLTPKAMKKIFSNPKKFKTLLDVLGGAVGGALGGIGLGGFMKWAGNSSHKKGAAFGDNIKTEMDARKAAKADIDVDTSVKADATSKANSAKIPTQAQIITDNEDFYTKLEFAESREDFKNFTDYLKSMEPGEEKTKLSEAYQNKYNEWKNRPERPDIRMQYHAESDLPIIEGFIPKHISDTEADIIAKEFGLNDDDIKSLRIKIPTHFNEFMNALLIVNKYTGENYDKKVISDKCDNFKDNEYCLPYLNEDNIQKLLNQGLNVDNALDKIIADINYANAKLLNEDLVNQLIELGYRKEDFVIIIKKYEENPEITKDLIKATMKDSNGKEVPRFSGSDIKSIVAAYKDEPNFTKDLIDATMKDSNGNEVPRFRGSDIKSIVAAYKDEPNFTKDLIDATKKDLHGNDISRFKGYEIKSIVEISKENLELTNDLINATVKDFNGNDTPRFDYSEIKSIVEISQENLELTKDLIKATMKNSKGKDVPRFNGSDIKSIVAAYKDEPNFTKDLIDAKKFANGKEVPRFNGSDIEILFKEFKSKQNDFYKLADWLNENPNLSGNEIILLYKTQLEFYRQAEKANAEKLLAEEKALNKTKPSVDLIKSDEMLKFENDLVKLGLNSKYAEKFVELTHINGIVDKNKSEVITKLLETFKSEKKGKIVFDITPKDIEKIFNLATSTSGEFRSEFISDIIKLKSHGVNDIKFAINLSAMINMPDIELKARLNGNVRNDVIERFKKLPDEVRSNLEKDGVNLESLEAKNSPKTLDGKKINRENKNLSATVRKFEDIVGVEKVVLNKFRSEVPQEVWSNPESFKKWAQERLAKILDFEQNPDYTAIGNYANYNKARKDGVESWYKFLKEESNYKDDVFVHLLVMDGITRDMKHNNAVIPPAVSNAEFEATYNALLAADTKVSFSKIYAQQLRKKAIKKYTTDDVSLNGVEGKWVTIPRSQEGDLNYDENIAMVQALSEGSSWCLRYESAHEYLQEGNLHFFIDKYGSSQVAINETNGTITQIQKRYDQNDTVPVAYSEVIASWSKKNKYTGHESEIKTALKAKPEFDKLRNQIQELLSENNIEKVFDLLNIKYKKLDDGTYSIETYRAKINSQYTLNDLGIDETVLLANVSEIRSLYLDGSNARKLPILKKIFYIKVGDSKIQDFSTLENIANKEIIWIK